MAGKDIESIIDRAIKNEEEAHAFYMDLYNFVEDREAKDTLLYLAKEEAGHKEFLQKYRQQGFAGVLSGLSETDRYKIAEHEEKPDVKKNLKTKDVYLVAAGREKNSHEFYKNLAELHPESAVKDMLLKMAAEELKHKEKVEYLDANTAFPQTAGG
ncbi:MAG: ferritin family protein [Deltaproteobacteria bacterium]|nr:ferritin family protein [Deltaproteobacteria bacterium]